MANLSNIIRILPPMKSGKELLSALEVLPEYDSAICNADAPVRLMALSDLYRVYVPNQMSLEIYSKLYLALMRSLQKKGTTLAIQQRNQNYRAIVQQEYSGIMGGSDSFTIIGASGIGKSSAISRAITLITENRIIEVENPHTKIIPCICVQCPFDSSVKGLLLEILRKVDEVIGGNYYPNALRARTTTDMLIGSVSQVALNHIGLLVVDEIQNVCNSKNGKSLVGMLTQLINNSGISICMVGTPESAVFFEQAMQLARRSVGLQYGALQYDGYFREFASLLFRYQYVKNRTELSDSVVEWLYEHSGGIISTMMLLVHDAQEIAIFNGREILDVESLNGAYVNRLALLHGFVSPSIKQNQRLPQKKEKPAGIASKGDTQIPADYMSIPEIVQKAKNQSMDVVSLLKTHISVTEVPV